MTIDHVAMYVEDLEKARDFFVKYLDGKANEGYHNRFTDFQSYFIAFDGGTRLELMTRPGLIDSGNELLKTGYIHIAFQVGSKEKVDTLTERLRKDGFEVISGPRTTGDGYYESSVVGVEDNQIEITI